MRCDEQIENCFQTVNITLFFSYESLSTQKTSEMKQRLTGNLLAPENFISPFFFKNSKLIWKIWVIKYELTATLKFTTIFFWWIRNWNPKKKVIYFIFFGAWRWRYTRMNRLAETLVFNQRCSKRLPSDAIPLFRVLNRLLPPAPPLPSPVSLRHKTTLTEIHPVLLHSVGLASKWNYNQLKLPITIKYAKRS